VCERIPRGQMTARYAMYAAELAQFIKPDYKPQIVRDPLLH
jgi:beta-ureidopropionase